MALHLFIAYHGKQRMSMKNISQLSWHGRCDMNMSMVGMTMWSLSPCTPFFTVVGKHVLPCRAWSSIGFHLLASTKKQGGQEQRQALRMCWTPSAVLSINTHPDITPAGQAKCVGCRHTILAGSCSYVDITSPVLLHTRASCCWVDTQTNRLPASSAQKATVCSTPQKNMLLHPMTSCSHSLHQGRDGVWAMVCNQASNRRMNAIAGVQVLVLAGTEAGRTPSMRAAANTCACPAGTLVDQGWPRRATQRCGWLLGASGKPGGPVSTTAAAAIELRVSYSVGAIGAVQLWLFSAVRVDDDEPGQEQVVRDA